MQIGMDLENVNLVPRPVCVMLCTENTKPSVTWYRPVLYMVLALQAVFFFPENKNNSNLI